MGVTREGAVVEGWSSRFQRAHGLISGKPCCENYGCQFRSQDNMIYLSCQPIMKREGRNHSSDTDARVMISEMASMLIAEGKIAFLRSRPRSVPASGFPINRVDTGSLALKNRDHLPTVSRIFAYLKGVRPEENKGANGHIIPES